MYALMHHNFRATVQIMLDSCTALSDKAVLNFIGFNLVLAWNYFLIRHGRLENRSRHERS